MLKLLKNLRKIDLLFIFLSIGLILLQVWLDLKLPGYMKQITENLVSVGGNQAVIWNYGLKMLGCALASAILSALVGFFSARISSSFGMNLRTKVFDKVQSFSMEEIQKFSTASLITRSTNDITQVQSTIAIGMQVLIKAPIMAVWAIIEILNKSWQWSVATAVAVVILLMLILVITIFAVPKFKVIQRQTDDINKVTRENLLGTRVVRAYNAEKYEEERFEKVNDELTKTHLYVSKIMALMSPAMSLIMSVLSLSIYWIGVILINNAFLAQKAELFSDMMAFSQYATRVVMAFIMLAMIFIILPRAIVSANRINQVLNCDVKIVDGEINVESSLKGEIEFKNVSFKYPDADEYVLKNISFNAHMGETVAFIGSTGSGKSTLINLVPRFYDATEGEILIDGQNIKNYTLTQLHNKLGYIPQRAVIFTGTIKDNLTIGSNGKGKPDNDELKKASKIAQADEFIDSRPEGYDYNITQGGTNLSGGQKQRLAIARAVAREPEIFIFDDSFSALDYKTDFNLRATLAKECKNSTKLIVAQRIGTIKDADKIIVLNNGEIVGMGKHEELLNSCAVYNEIALSQLSKEELE